MEKRRPYPPREVLFFASFPFAQFLATKNFLIGDLGTLELFCFSSDALKEGVHDIPCRFFAGDEALSFPWLQEKRLLVRSLFSRKIPLTLFILVFLFFLLFFFFLFCLFFWCFLCFFWFFFCSVSLYVFLCWFSFFLSCFFLGFFFFFFFFFFRGDESFLLVMKRSLFFLRNWDRDSFWALATKFCIFSCFC